MSTLKELPRTIRHGGRDVCIHWYQRKVGPLPEWFTNPKTSSGKQKRKCDFSDNCASDAIWKKTCPTRIVNYCDHHKNRMVTEGRDNPMDYSRLNPTP